MHVVNVKVCFKEDEYESAKTYHIDKSGHNGSKVWYTVNKRLLPVKGLYFTFIAGIYTYTSYTQKRRRKISVHLHIPQLSNETIRLLDV